MLLSMFAELDSGAELEAAGEGAETTEGVETEIAQLEAAEPARNAEPTPISAA